MIGDVVIAATGSKALWYFTRGSGAVALVLLSLSFALGVATLVGFNTRRISMLVVQLLHRNVSLLVLVFLLAHVGTTVVDGFAPIGWLDVVIPFHSPYRTTWLGLGAVATDVLLAVVVTSLLRVHIGLRLWRLVHWTSYAAWPLAAVHSLKTGSDTGRTWMVWVDALTLLATVGAVGWRLVARPPARLKALFVDERLEGRTR